MFRKDCNKCKGPSFSADRCGKWICPYCDKDLSDLPVKTVKGKGISWGKKKEEQNNQND